MTKPKCEDCRFFEIYEVVGVDLSDGECHRYPPKNYQGESSFQGVYKEEWCGEFKQKDKEQD